MKRPIILGIGGSHSKVGKTTLVTALLNKLKGWGAIKYTKTALYSSIIEDRETLSLKGKDTRHFLDAGATTVLWVQSPASGLSEIMSLAMERLSNLEGIIIEGNSAIEFLKPDIIIFISEKDSSRLKESGKRVQGLADIIYYRDVREILIKGGKNIKGGIEEVISIVCDMVNKKGIERYLSERAVDKRIPCSVAREIAEKAKVPYKVVGLVADELGIKITNCELGCF